MGCTRCSADSFVELVISAFARVPGIELLSLTDPARHVPPLYLLSHCSRPSSVFFEEVPLSGVSLCTIMSQCELQRHHPKWRLLYSVFVCLLE